MNNELLLQENLDLWSREHPKEAIWIQGVDPSDFDESVFGSGEWASSVDFGDAQTIYLYGVGLGQTYPILQKWLREDPRRQLVYLEDDLRVLYRLFETDQGTAILRDPQTRAVYFEDAGSKKLESLYWSSVNAPFLFIADPYYEKEKKEKCLELRHKLSYDAAMKNANLDGYLKYGVGFYRNYYTNLKLLPDSLLGNELFGKFQGVPAIICGAGPSLEKQLPHLRKLQDRALLFAGGSSVNALVNAGIIPHFGVGIDPNPELLERVKRLPTTQFPFFYRNRIFHYALQEIHGPHLYITGSGGYDIADWIEDQLGIPHQELEEGHNVLNFSIQIAALLGCNPILCVGMDLAFTGMKQYAAGVLDDPSVTEEQIMGRQDFNSEALMRPDIEGKQVYTLWKWVTEAEWVGEFAKENPELTLINATEGGIGFPSVENKPFEEAAEEYLGKTFKLDSKIKERLRDAAMPGVTREKITSVLLELKESLASCLKHLDVLIQEAERALKERKEDYEQSGLAALAESDLADEPAFEAVLGIFNAAYTKTLQREVELVKKMRGGKGEALYRLNLKKYQFLHNAAAINIEILDHTYFADV